MPGYGEVVARAPGWTGQRRASQTQMIITKPFFFLLIFFPWVLLQPLASLAFPTLHFLVPLQRGLSLNLDMLVSVGTEP